MFQLWRRSSHQPIGIEFDSHGIRLAQVRPGQAGLSVVTATVQAPPAEAKPNDAGLLVDLLEQALDAAAFHRRDVVTCLPPSQLWLRHMRMAPMPNDELRAAAHWQAAQQLNLDPGAFQSDLLDVGDVIENAKPKRELIVVAATSEALQQHLDILTQAGLNPLAIDVPACAIARCLAWRALREGQPGPQLILNIGRTTSTLVIAHEGLPRFVRNISVGTADVDQRLAKALEMPLDEAQRLGDARRGLDASEESPASADASMGAALDDARQPLVRELAQALSMSLQHYARLSRQPAPTHGTLVGEGAVEPTLDQLLSQATGLMFSMPTHQPTPQSAAPHLWTVATGLSLYHAAAHADQVSTGAAA